MVNAALRGARHSRPWRQMELAIHSSGRACRSGPGRVEARWRWRGAGFDAELVALRVPHDRVARVAALHDGPERLQPGHLGGDRAGGTQVEVHAVLGRLGLGDPDEPDV